MVIYKITNLINKKFYIGSALNPKKRKTRHFRHLKNNKHDNIFLQRAYNKYGLENFIFQIIEEYSWDDEDFIIKREQYYLDKFYDKQKKCYNISPFADRPPSQKGKPKSEEHKQKISEANKTFWANNPESKIVQAEINKGRKCSDEAKKKMSEAKLGKPLSDDHKQKLGEIFSGENNPFFGKKHSDETKQKLREFRIGKKHSEETKRKIRNTLKNNHNPIQS
jgi:group I intron endonuclease